MNLFTPVFQFVQNIAAVLGLIFDEKQILRASDAYRNDEFGFSVDISGDGTRIIVGAHKADANGINSGAVYIYRDSNGTWVEEDIFIGSDTDSSDNFGYDVAISEDGTRAIVGASGDPAGYVFSRSGTTWTEEQKLTASDGMGADLFGWRVSITGDGSRVIIGAPYEDGGAGDPASNSGAAYVYSRSGTTWTEEQILRASDAQLYDYFGQDVSISSDGTRVIVGAFRADEPTDNEGAAYVFSRSGTTWTQEQKLTASNGQQSDLFGTSVVISEDGTRVAVSAYLSDEANPSDTDWNNGSIYTFTRSGTTWTQEAHFYDPDGNQYDGMGANIDMTSDGSRIIAGAVGQSGPNGKAYVFSRSDTTWTMAPIITASDAQSNDQFGSDVAISDDGTKLVVGANLEDGGAGNPKSNSGAAYVFEEV